MRGRIVKRKGSNNYTIILQLGLDPCTGKRKQQWITVGPSKREAEDKLTELIHDHNTGTYIKPEKTTISDYLNRWLEECARQNLSPRSFERYADIIKNRFTPEFGNVQLRRLKPEHLQKHYSKMLQSGLSSRTVRYHHAVIHVANGHQMGIVGSKRGRCR